MPSEDLGAPAYRKFDVEAWMPGLKRYGEVHFDPVTFIEEMHGILACFEMYCTMLFRRFGLSS